jgi:1-phosphofructokinase family hexose kinase
VIITLTLNPVLDRTLTVPRLQLGEVLRATSTRLDWGGKGFNVSRTLQALGASSLAMGLIGGATGQQLARGLSDLGITTDLVQVAGETRTNVVVREAGSDRHLKVNEPGPTVEPLELDALLERVRARVRNGDLWILSGSLPPGVPVGLYGRLIGLIQAGGARACLDSSGEPLRLGCAARPYLVKPNALEAGEMAGKALDSDTSVLAAAQSFLDLGIELVALSLGSGGLLLASCREAVWVRPPEARILNAVGAGDALLAGVAWALEGGLPLADLACWGVAAGTSSAATEGVAAGSRAGIQKLYGQTQVWRRWSRPGCGQGTSSQDWSEVT